MAPYKIRKEGYVLSICLADARRMLPFMVEQVFLLTGMFGMHNVDTQCAVEGREEAKEQRNYFMVKFSLTRLRI